MTKWTIIVLLALVACGQVNDDGNNDKTFGEPYPTNFNTKLTADDEQILAHFEQRRTSFDDYIKSTDQEIFTCPSCGFPTIDERGVHNICDICDWQDDGQDDEDADETWGGPNGKLSLTKSRLLIGHELQNLADSLNGTIVTNQEKCFSILKEHNRRMEISGNKIKRDTDISDPL
ncbi:MAG: CPCC family cysteine-rich protein, partial [Crocinitomicaceae bacterium]|nr:CPCC family cysteine-rich protein [Crocinitomicaceae bacterium]